MPQPRRCSALEHLRHLQIIPRELVKCFEDRQMRLRPGKPFGASSSTYAALPLDSANERIDDRRFANSGLSGQREHTAWAGGRIRKFTLQSVQLADTADDHGRMALAEFDD